MTSCATDMSITLFCISCMYVPAYTFVLCNTASLEFFETLFPAIRTPIEIKAKDLVYVLIELHITPYARDACPSCILDYPFPVFAGRCIRAFAPSNAAAKYKR